MRKNSGFQFEQKIKSDLAAIGLKTNDRVIVALSGGPDSICLAYVLSKIGYKILASHVNFKLRGIESDLDEAFVKRWCEKFGIESVCTSYDTKSIAAKNKEGIEATARKLRYSWFGTMCTERKINHVVTGHHLNDQAELILMNLMRGTGMDGAKGMQFNSILPYSDQNKKLFLLRPLLSYTKEEILEYLNTGNIEYRIDTSNEQNDFTRNKIRNQVLPLMETINANTIKHIAEFGNKVRSILPFYEKYIHTLNKKLVTTIEGKIKIKRSHELNEHSLFHLLEPYGFNEDTVKQIFQALVSQKKGRKFSSPLHTAMIGNQSIDIIKLNPKLTNLQIESLPFSIFHAQGEIRLKKCNSRSNPSLTQSIMNGNELTYPLTIRNWTAGDRMKPLGMKGKSKKIKDILTDHKVSGADKKSALVLLSNDEIIWLYPTNTISETVKYNDSTKIYICLEIKNPSIK